jgi:cell division protein FtsB
LNRAGNTYWLNNRNATEQSSAQVLPLFSAREVSREFVPTTVAWLGLIPSWIFLGMILLATLGICFTVIGRTRAESKASFLQYQHMSAEIDRARRTNELLQLEIRRMTSDPNMIESEARTRLGMVRPNDIVVPVDSVKQASALGTLSFVR